MQDCGVTGARQEKSSGCKTEQPSAVAIQLVPPRSSRGIEGRPDLLFCACLHGGLCFSLCVLLQRFRTITIDKKTVKLQIWVRTPTRMPQCLHFLSLSLSLSGCMRPVFTLFAAAVCCSFAVCAGHCGSRTLPHHHQCILSRCRRKYVHMHQ
jgi:hypothetical protein